MKPRFPQRLCRIGALLAVPVAIGLSAPPAASQTITYQVKFEGNWTLASTPGGVVGGAHFTTLIGGVHGSGVTFWASGQKASAGVELVAELGYTPTFRSEVLASPHTGSVIQAGPSGGGTGTATFNIDVTRTHPLVTLLSMIGPSPDWFVGVSGVSLLDGSNQWRASHVVDLFPYDAGTEDGTEFTLGNPATSPQGVITGIAGTGKFSNVRMARLTFTRLTTPPPPPTPSVSLSVSPNPVNEGQPVTVTAQLSAALSNNVTIPLSLASGTAESRDFGALASITVTGGQTTGTGTITTVDDADADDETFTVSLGTLPAEVTAGTPSSVEVTIRDGDEPPPPPKPSVSLSVSPNPVAEGRSVTVTARLSATLSNSVTIPLELTPGSAEAGDYGTLASITVAGGQTAGRGSISTKDDADTADETFTVSLGTLPAEVTAGSPSSIEVTIRDGDEPPPSPKPSVSLSVSPNPVDEGQSVTVTARLSAALSDSVTIPLTLASGTAEADDFGALASITVSGGQRTGTGTIATTDDADLDDETFTVSLGTLPAEVTAGSPSSVEVTIRDGDEPPPPPKPAVSLSVSPNPVVEGQPVTVSVNLSETLSNSVTIPLTLTPGSAESGDFGSLASITVSGGQTTGTGTISTVDDADEEDETFTVSLGTLPADVMAGSPSSVAVTIQDDDFTPLPANNPPTVRASCSPCTVPRRGDVRLEATASDPDGDAVSYEWSAAQGTFTGATDGQEALWTAPDRIGTFAIRVEVADGRGGTAAAVVAVEVGNRPPEFGPPPDFEIAENRDGRATPLTLGRVHVTDPDGDAVELGLAPGSDRFAIDPVSGLLSYTGPGEDFEAGPNRYALTVTATDGLGGEARVEVVVDVVDVNEHPAAADDSLSVDEDGRTRAEVLANDADPDGGDRIRVISAGAPGHGQARVVDAGAAVEYAPDPNYHGPDRFSYVVADAAGLADTATVEVTVTPVNDAPEAADDQATTPEDEAVEIPVLDNDADLDGDRLRVQSVSAPGHGTAEVAAQGTNVTYTPDPNYHGPDRFTYVAADPDGLADTATVEITVTPVNDGPAAVGAIPDQLLDEGADAVTVDLTPYFSDIDGDPLAFSARTSDANVVTATVSGAALVLLPVAYGDATVIVTATDPGGLAATQRVTVGVSDRAARAVLNDAFAAMARSYLSSARMTLQRRVASGAHGAGSAAGRQSGLRVGGRPVTLRDAHTLWTSAPGTPVSGTDFTFGWPVQAADSARPGVAWSLWGQADVQRYDGGADESGSAPAGIGAGYEGDLRVQYLGLDAQLPGWLFGVAMGRSRGAGDWNAGSAGGRLSTSMTSVHPYLRWSGGATSVWTTFGAGRGEARNERTATGRVGTSPLDLSVGLVEFQRRLVRTDGAVEFGLRADAGWASLSTGEGTETVDDLRGRVHQARLGLDVRSEMRVGAAGLAPFGAVHLRRDGGDGQTGRGVELSGGLRAQLGVVGLDVQGRWLAFHSATRYGESGAGLTLTVGGRGEEGFSLSASPRWGGHTRGGVALWQNRAPGMQPRPDTSPAGWTMDVRGAYRARPGGRLLEVSTVYDRAPGGQRLQLMGQIALGLASRR